VRKKEGKKASLVFLIILVLVEKMMKAAAAYPEWLEHNPTTKPAYAYAEHPN
jgi:hypothetical protein